MSYDPKPQKGKRPAHVHHAPPDVLGADACPKCSCPESRVLFTRRRPGRTYRVRRCLNPKCGNRFRTAERLESVSSPGRVH